MRKGGGKSKGGEYERVICKKISRWITNDKRDDLFWRSAMSGGRSTVAKKKGEISAANAGDISAVDKKGYPFAKHFYSECKAIKDLNIKNIIKETGRLYTFWEITKKEARYYKKMPLLWCKENNFPQFVCLDYDGACQFILAMEEHFDLIAPQQDLYLITQDKFFELADKTLVKKTKKVKRVRM